MTLSMLRSLWSTRVTAFPRNLLGNNASRVGLRRNIIRRGMASKSHQAASSDTPWIVASTLLFGPTLVYLLGPGSASVVTGHGDSSKDPHPSGHGAAPAPLTKESIPHQAGPSEVEEAEDKSTHDSEAASDNAEQADEQQSDTPHTSQKENENTEKPASENLTESNETSQGDDKAEISEEHQENNQAPTETHETDSTDKDNKQNKAD